MRVFIFAFLALASAFGQQFEVLNSNLPGLVARDSQGNWIIADGFNPNLAKLRVRKFSLDLTQTLFDHQIGGSGSDQPMRLRLDEFGNIYVLGFTTSAHALKQCRRALRQPARHQDSCPVLKDITGARPQRRRS